MGEKTHTSKGIEIKRENEKVDLRKHKKRLTTFEEKQEIMENRKKYKEEDLKDKMQKISDIQNGKDNGMQKKKNKINRICYPEHDPYGLAEAWWKIFTKPERK